LSVGLDKDRLALLLAVLHRAGDGWPVWTNVFVNAVGGVRIHHPAADLAVMLAITSTCAGGRCLRSFISVKSAWQGSAPARAGCSA
jgi:DNA repair protein RadA/Sms